MKLIRKPIIAVLALIFCWSLIGSAFAAQEISAAQNAADLYLHEEQFSTDYKMDGLFSQCIKYFSVGNWDIGISTVTLRYTTTQLADRTLSSLTFTLNGQEFYSGRVEPGINGKIQELKVELPISSIREGQNSLVIDTYLRTVGSLPCADDVSKANWLMISKESSIALQYTPRAVCTNIADFCEEFVSIDALENKQSTVAVSPKATNTELSAAAIVLTGLSGRAVMHYDNIALMTAEAEKALSPYKYCIYISKLTSLPSDLADRLSSEENRAAQNGALIALLKPDGKSNVLLITGSSDDALMNAAKSLGNAAYLAQIESPWKSIAANENVLMPKKEIDQFRKLTESGASVSGLFRKSAYFYIDFPDNRTLAYSSQVSLVMRYSENLDFDRSLVTVYINGNPIGSKKLEKIMAQGDSVVFNIPADLQVSGNFTVETAFDLELKDVPCTLRPEDMPWAWVSSESVLKLSSKNVDSLIFEYYPSPFVKDGSLNKVVAVLPDSPEEADLDALRQIMLTLGRNLDDNAGELRVAHASMLGDLSSSNIISIGRYKNNSLAQKNNDRAFFRFNADGTTLISNEKMLIDPGFGVSLGAVQLLNSPYSSEKRALMLVTGASDEAMLRGVKYIGLSDSIWKIYGDAYVSDGVDVFSYRFKLDNAKEQDITEEVLSRTDIGYVALVAGLVIILVLLSIILLFRKHRKARKGDMQ